MRVHNDEMKEYPGVQTGDGQKKEKRHGAKTPSYDSCYVFLYKLCLSRHFFCCQAVSAWHTLQFHCLACVKLRGYIAPSLRSRLFFNYLQVQKRQHILYFADHMFYIPTEAS